MESAKTEQKIFYAGCKQDSGRRLAGRLLMKPHQLKRPQLGLTTNQQQSWSQLQVKRCKLHTLGGHTASSLTICLRLNCLLQEFQPLLLAID